MSDSSASQVTTTLWILSALLLVVIAGRLMQYNSECERLTGSNVVLTAHGFNCSAPQVKVLSP